MDEENKVNEPIEEQVVPTEPAPEPATEQPPVVEEPVEEKVEPTPTEEVPHNTEPTPPKKKGNGGVIAAVIIIIILLAAGGVLGYMLLNKDEEDSDKKSSKNDNTSNSAQIEEDEEEPDDEDEDEDEDEDKGKSKKKDDVKTVEANGAEYLSDYSAFAFKIEDLKGYIKDNMKDPDQKLKEKNGEYEILLNNNVKAVAKVDDDGYVKDITFSVDVDTTTSEEDANNIGLQTGVYYGQMLTKIFDDPTKITNKITSLSNANEHLDYDENGSYPQKVYENYEIIDHAKVTMTITLESETEITTSISLSPDKKESGSKY